MTDDQTCVTATYALKKSQQKTAQCG